jgi:hypothetical protein
MSPVEGKEKIKLLCSLHKHPHTLTIRGFFFFFFFSNNLEKIVGFTFSFFLI